jgi:hypothetical protein
MKKYKFLTYHSDSVTYYLHYDQDSSYPEPKHLVAISPPWTFVRNLHRQISIRRSIAPKAIVPVCPLVHVENFIIGYPELQSVCKKWFVSGSEMFTTWCIRIGVKNIASDSSFGRILPNDR